ncbi:MAG: hypothetical protein AAF899_03215 [Pseudomonadota bacterium]
MPELSESAAGLWLAVIVSGLFHGASPGMGWPLAVSAALFERRGSALWGALSALAAGHLVAMLAFLLPFGLLTALIAWQREIQVAAALVVLGLGLWLLIRPRHPRFLSRVPPTRLALWSFLVAVAHGAALMLVPIYLGICAIEGLDAGHRAAETLMQNGILLAFTVATIHTIAMLSAGGALAWGVYRWLGLRFLSRAWFDLDTVWAASLIAVGALAIALAA